MWLVPYGPVVERHQLDGRQVLIVFADHRALRLGAGPYLIRRPWVPGTA